MITSISTRKRLKDMQLKLISQAKEIQDLRSKVIVLERLLKEERRECARWMNLYQDRNQ